MKCAILMFIASELLIPRMVCAQVPTGSVTGFVTDATGARIAGASVVVTNRESGLKRTLVTADAGDYSAPELLPAHYYDVAAAPGFKRLARETTVDAGTTTTVNLAMQVGLRSKSVNDDTTASPEPSVN